MPPQTLRDYQIEGLERIKQSWKSGARSVLAIAPTGSGKTSLFAFLTMQVAQKHRVLILVHRRELAEQASNRLREFNVFHGFELAGLPLKRSASVQIASVSTLVRRNPPPADLVICDEAHLSTANTWHSVLSNYPKAKILGVTATPWRLAGKPLIGAYDSVVVVSTPEALRIGGYLCDFIGFSYKHPDMTGVGVSEGEYNQRDSAAKMQKSLIVDSITQEWERHASHLSTVVFAVTVEHSKQLCARFRAIGATAEHLDGATSLEQRRAILKRVGTGVTRILCNVGVAVEGLDIPRLKCCILARPTKSLARAIQMMGRVRRTFEGLTARIHDHAFVTEQHGLPDDERDYTLTARLETPMSLLTCPQCYAIFRGRVCPECRLIREPEARALPKTVETAEQVEFSSNSVSREKPIEIRWNDTRRVIEGILGASQDMKVPWGIQKQYGLIREGKLYHVPAPTDLHHKLRNIPLGSLVRITELDKQHLGGLNFKRLFKVEVDK